MKQSVLFSEEFEGATFEVTTGDYAQLLSLVCENLEQAVVSIKQTNEQTKTYINFPNAK